MNPVSRDTIVPAAITALDFSRPPARPPFLARRPVRWRARLLEGRLGRFRSGRHRVLARRGRRVLLPGRRSGAAVLTVGRCVPVRVGSLGRAVLSRPRCPVVLPRRRCGGGHGGVVVVGGVAAALLLVPEEVGEGVRLVALLAGLGDQVVHADVLGGPRVVAVRQVLRRALRLGGWGLGPDAWVGGRRETGRAGSTAAAAADTCPGAAGVRGAVVERLGDRVLGREVLRPVGIPGRRRPGGTCPRGGCGGAWPGSGGGPSGLPEPSTV